MTIALSPQTQKLLEEQLKAGQYRSADDVIHAALEALSEHQLDQDSLDAIDLAEDQIEQGDVHDWKDVREQLRERFLGR